MISLFSGNTNDMAVNWILELAATWWLQSCILLLFGLFIAACLRSRGPAVQSVIYRVTMAAVLLCPIASQLLAASGVSLFRIDLHSQSTAEPPSAAIAQRQPIATLATDVPNEVVPSIHDLPSLDAELITASFSRHDGTFENSSSHSIDDNRTEPATASIVQPDVANRISSSRIIFAFILILLVWIVGTVWFAGRILLDVICTNALRKKAEPGEDAASQVCREVASQLGVRIPQVLSTPFLSSPCLLGHWRPAVLVPEGTETGTYHQLFLHELAHLRRGDWLWNLIGRSAHALLWSQPLMWLLVRRNAAAAEDVCDDYVLSYGCNREGYLRHLLDIAEKSVPQAAIGVSMVGFRSKLAWRAHRILDTSRVLSTRTSRLFAATALVTTFLATATVATLAVGQAKATASEQLDEAGANEDLVKSGNPSVAADAKEDSKPASVAEPSNKIELPRKIIGRVVGPLGKPFSKATVYAEKVVKDPKGPASPEARVPVNQTTSAKDGTFSLDLARGAFDNGTLKLVATAKGYGPAFLVDYKLATTQNPTLRLRREQPIEGRVLDTEGRPIGGIKLRVMQVIPPTSEDAVTDWIKNERRELFAGNDENWWDNSIFFTQFPRDWNDGSLVHGSRELPPDMTTQSDGRFRFDRLGANQLVVLEASGPTIAKQFLSVVTREMDSVVATPLTFEGTPNPTHYGAKFTFVARPSQPIVGTVTDIDSSMPIAGMKIRVNQFAGSINAQGNFLTAMTDEQGRFRIDGAPRGGGHELTVDPALDQPYFETDFRLKETSEPGPIECALAVRKTKWIEGRVTDEDGQPIKAYVHYNPFLDNKNAELFPEKYVPTLRSAPGTRIQSSDNGEFRIQAIAGRGALTAQINGTRRATEEFIRGATEDVLTEVGGSRLSKVFNGFSANAFHSIQVVDVADDDDETRYDITVMRGSPVSLDVVGADNKPVSGTRVLGRTFPPYLEKERQPSRVQILGLSHGQERLVVVYHDATKQGRTFVVRGGDAPRTVKLAPCAIAKGQLLDEVGEPVAAREIQVSPLDSEQGNNWRQDIEGTKTDDEGRFEVLLPPGEKQYLVTTRSSRMLARFRAKIKPQPGAVYDLGELRTGDDLDAAATSRRMVDSTRSRSAATPSATTRPVAITSREQGQDVTIRGKVVDPSGNSVAEATLLLISNTQTAQMLPVRKLVLRTKSDSTGRFSVTTKQPGPLDHPSVNSMHIVAMKLGWGTGWRRITDKEIRRGNVAIRLSEEKKITGRLYDLEGRPLSDIQISVTGLAAAKENVDLEAWHAKAKKNPSAGDQSYIATSSSWYYGDDNTIARFPSQTGVAIHGIRALPTSVTATDGSFEIRGVGRNHQATLAIAGRGVATTLIRAVARDMEAVNMPTPDSRFATQKLYGANFDYAAHPSRVVRGRVVDKETKKPLKGVEIQATHTVNGTHDSDVFLSDDQGRFEITNLPARDGLRLRVKADHIPYFRPEDIVVSQTTGTTPVDVTIELEKGEWIRGKIADAETGKPMAAGWVSYYPFFSNKNAEKFSHYRLDMMTVGYGDRVAINSDGTYRIVGVPGRGIVLCGAVNAGIYKHGAGADKIEGLFGKAGGPRPRVYHLISVTMGNSVSEVDVRERAGATCDIELEPLDRRPIFVRDQQRQPLSGYRVTGLLPAAMNVPNPYLEMAPIRSQTSFEVYGLADNAPRTLLVQHPERKLARAVELNGSELDSQAEKSIELLPAATITGRVRGIDGQPIVGARAHLNYKTKQRRLTLLGGNAKENLSDTDVYFGSTEVNDDGKFSFDLIPSGISYQLVVTSESRAHQAKADIAKVNPGQHIDVGQLSLAPKPKRQGGSF